jgi:hypothetical protein
MRENGFIVCGDPDYVTRWLENDMRIAGHGHFMGMADRSPPLLEGT